MLRMQAGVVLLPPATKAVMGVAAHDEPGLHRMFKEAKFAVVQKFTMLTPVPMRLSSGANQHVPPALGYASGRDDKLEQPVVMFVVGYGPPSGAKTNNLGNIISELQRCPHRINRHKNALPTWSQRFPHELAASTYERAVLIARAVMSVTGFDAHLTTRGLKVIRPTSFGIVLTECTGQATKALLDVGYADVRAVLPMPPDHFSEAHVHSVMTELYAHIEKRALESIKDSPHFPHEKVYFNTIDPDEVRIPPKSEWQLAYEEKFGPNKTQEELLKVCVDHIPSRGRQLPRRPPCTALELLERRVVACRR